MNQITAEVIDDEEIFSIPEGSFAFAMMIFVKRGEYVTFQFKDTAGRPTDRVKCAWNEVEGCYKQRE